MFVLYSQYADVRAKRVRFFKQSKAAVDEACKGDIILSVIDNLPMLGHSEIMDYVHSALGKGRGVKV